MKSKNKRGPFALQRNQKLYRTYGLSVLSDFRSIEGVIKDVLAVFAPAGGNEDSLVDVNEFQTAGKEESEESLATFEEKLADA